MTAAAAIALTRFSEVLWGAPLLVLLLGTGLFLTARLRFRPLLRAGDGLRLLAMGTARPGEGTISPFAALATALSATVGIGNIVGVATAIFLGGPGAIFWMWLTALFGVATKYSEAVLAVKYRRRTVDEYVGGPMYYITEGLGRRWHPLAVAFALFGTAAAFGIGNTVQANSVARALETSLGVPNPITGLVLAVLVGAVIVGGVRRIGRVASTVVPAMIVLYVGGCLAILVINWYRVPAALELIVQQAFVGGGAQAGFAGGGLLLALRTGVARGIFSNEAGLGSAPIAHAAAATESPVRQGSIAAVAIFIDTLLVGTVTALVILVSGQWLEGFTGAELSARAFRAALPGPGDLIVTVSLIFFAFSTILGWSYYGEKCLQFLAGAGAIMPYRLAWAVAVFLGAVAQLDTVWTLADIMNGLMALPNLTALLLLSPVVARVTLAVARRRSGGTRR